MFILMSLIHCDADTNRTVGQSQSNEHDHELSFDASTSFNVFGKVTVSRCFPFTSVTADIVDV